MFSRRRGALLRSCSVLGAFVVCLALAVGGCGDDDEGPLKPQPGPSYPDLSMPQNVLEALEIAYSMRDSTKYKELHDPTYTGRSTDLNDPGTTIDLTFADEAAHIAALAATPGLSAFLELGSTATWNRMPSDDPSHPEWSIIQISGAQYRVEVMEAGSDAISAIGEAGTFLEFGFSPTLDSTSPTDTLWRIVRWRETGNGAPNP